MRLNDDDDDHHHHNDDDDYGHGVIVTVAPCFCCCNSVAFNEGHKRHKHSYKLICMYVKVYIRIANICHTKINNDI